MAVRPWCDPARLASSLERRGPFLILFDEGCAFPFELGGLSFELGVPTRDEIKERVEQLVHDLDREATAA
jgi:hypothetical protein